MVTVRLPTWNWTTARWPSSSPSRFIRPRTTPWVVCAAVENPSASSSQPTLKSADKVAAARKTEAKARGTRLRFAMVFSSVTGVCSDTADDSHWRNEADENSPVGPGEQGHPDGG